jgi:hypothetical protein
MAIIGSAAPTNVTFIQGLRFALERSQSDQPMGITPREKRIPHANLYAGGVKANQKITPTMLGSTRAARVLGRKAGPTR